MNGQVKNTASMPPASLDWHRHKNT